MGFAALTEIVRVDHPVQQWPCQRSGEPDLAHENLLVSGGNNSKRNQFAL
jgi:hypothetical protein